MKVVDDADLTRQPRVIAQIGLCRKDRLFGIADRAGISCEDLDPASRAASVSTAAMKYVDPAVFEREYKFAIPIRFDRHLSVGRFSRDYVHQSFSTCS